MIPSLILSAIVLNTLTMHAQTPPTTCEAQIVKNVNEYNLQNGVGLKGFDPVSYFPEGDSVPTAGAQVFKIDYKGVKQNFDADIAGFEANADRFFKIISGEAARK